MCPERTVGVLRFVAPAGVVLVLVSVFSIGVAAQQPAGPRIIIATPSADEPLHDPVVVQALVRARQGREVDRVDAYINERHLGTLTEEPFRWEARAPAGAAVVIRLIAIDSEGDASTEELVVGMTDVASFAAEVRMVQFNLGVTGRGGTPIADLRPADIEVKDNGQVQQVRHFTRTEAPLKVALVIDRSASLGDRLTDAKRAVRAFLDQLEPDDQVMLIGVNHRIVTLSRFTRDRERILESVDGLVAEGGTALFDGLLLGLEQFDAGTAELERRVLFVFTDGADVSSRNPERRVVEAARQSAVTMYAVGQGDALDDGNLRDALRELGRSTGGEAIFEDDPRELPALFSRIARLVRGLYFVSYEPTSTAVGWHEIDVEVKRRGARAHHRPGYTNETDRGGGSR